MEGKAAWHLGCTSNTIQRWLVLLQLLCSACGLRGKAVPAAHCVEWEESCNTPTVHLHSLYLQDQATYKAHQTCTFCCQHAAYLCWELLLWDVWQKALGINIHGMATWWLHNGYPSITQQACQQLNLPAGAQHSTAQHSTAQHSTAQQSHSLDKAATTEHQSLTWV
jgi:hypothetical protein